jgi:hypothetical protein
LNLETTSGRLLKEKVNAEQDPNSTEHPGNSVNGRHDRVRWAEPGDERKNEGDAPLARATAAAAPLTEAD